VDRRVSWKKSILRKSFCVLVEHVNLKLIEAIFAGAVLGAAWLVPSTPAAAILGWLAAYCVCRFGQQPFYCYVVGCVAYCLAFAWLTFTIHYFGGFSSIPTFFIFMLFVFGSAAQFPLFAYCARALPKELKRSALHLPLAWLAGEMIMFRIFPWSPGHSQLAFTPLAVGASLGGVPLITFLMMWLCGALAELRSIALIPAISSLLLVLSYGSYYLEDLKILVEQAPSLNVAVVQANVSIEERSDQRFFGNNREHYLKLSSQYASNADLIVWPEGVIQDWIPLETHHVTEDDRLPRLDPPTAWIVGTMMYDKEHHFYNSSLAITPDGTVLPPYHKQVLMPFGEYIPFASLLGHIGGIGERIGGLTPGSAISVLEIPYLIGPRELASSSYSTVKITPLICYEDILPYLTSSAVKQGAQILVNLTNDAWFGRSAAAAQHHQIAAFRAIESGRTLVRSTNSGLTSIVLPDGTAIGSLTPFSSAVAQEKVPILNFVTPLQALGLGVWLSWIALTVVAIFLIKQLFDYLISPRRSNHS
jgi:apolipoprotein N-acyltransferase